MTVISSVYKDNDVKCHTSHANLPGVHPGFSFFPVPHLLCITLPSLTVLFLSHLHFFLLLTCCCHFVCIVTELCSLLSVFSPAPPCMLRRLVVAANGRVNICIYVNFFCSNLFFSWTREQGAVKIIGKKICSWCFFIISSFASNCTISFFFFFDRRWQ